MTESQDEVQEQEGFDENLARVTFTHISPSDIISPHSYSILAEPEPLAELPDTMREGIHQSFLPVAAPEGKGSGGKAMKKSNSAETVSGALRVHIPRSEIPSALAKCGFEYAINPLFEYTLKHLLHRYCDEQEEFDFAQLTDLVERLYAPAFLFGERLRRATARGQVNMVRELLLRGCAVNTGDGEGLTSLHFACAHDHEALVMLLVDCCGDRLLREARDKHGCTPLWIACFSGSDRCVDAMISLGADVNAANDHGRSCLHAAAAKDHASICTRLLAAGATLGADENDQTALHDACMSLLHPEAVLEALAAEDEARRRRDKLGYTHEDYTRMLLSN